MDNVMITNTPYDDVFRTLLNDCRSIALDEGTIKGNILTVTLPHSAVLFLRHHASTPDTLKIRMVTPGGTLKTGSN